MSGVREPRLIAVDGPSASGKSTVARLVAIALGYRYLDTGATYRITTLAALQAGFDQFGDARLPALAKELTAGFRMRLSMDPSAAGAWLDGIDVHGAIRSPEVTAAVSAVSAVSAVRRHLVDWQRAAAHAAGCCVLEGRDTGTVVAPDAVLKVWLTARSDVRASRRAHEAGVAAGADLARRDQLDSSRAVDPARPGPDAWEIDSSDHSAAELAQLIVGRLAR